MGVGTQRLVRLRPGAALALGVAAWAMACGKTSNHAGSNDEAAEAGSTWGGKFGDTANLGGERSDAAGETSGGKDGEAGAPPASGAGGFGGEGGAPEETRPVTVRIVDLVPQPLSGRRVLINGTMYESDDEGLVHAQAPLGAYDIVVEDKDGAEGQTGVSVFQGVTIDDPTLRLERDYTDQFEPRSSASGKIDGPYPPGAVGNVSFVGESGWLSWVLNSEPVDGNYSLSADWFVKNVSVAGDLFALLWTLGADQHPDAYWFGSAPVTWGPLVPVEQDLTVAAAKTHSVMFQMGTPEDATVSKSVWVGHASIMDPPLETELQLPRALSTSQGALNPRFFFMIQPLINDYETPYIRGSLAVGDDTSNVLVDAPHYLETLDPPANAKNVDPTTTTFKVSAIPNSCKVFEFLGGTYSPKIYTTKNGVVPPDLSAFGETWNKNWPASYWATAITPCPSIDALVAPTSDPAAQTVRFFAGKSHFRTRK